MITASSTRPEEMSRYAKHQLDIYDRLPREGRDWMKEHGG
jgi:hypothetical protein